MTNITISKAWFEDIKNEVAHAIPFYYTENGREKVEVDVDLAAFDKVSEEKGWC